MKLSEKMQKAGWPIVKINTTTYKVFAPGNKEFFFDVSNNSWSEPVKQIEKYLDKHLSLIEKNKASSFVTASRMTALLHNRYVSQPVKKICDEHLVTNKIILHLGTGLDNFAKQALLDAGALEVSDYDPNFYPDLSVLDQQYDLVLANYLLNILPPKERKQIYEIINQTLKPTGIAYLTVQGVWPVEHKYQIIKKYEDGYLIKDGLNTIFRKGYESAEFLQEIKENLGGQAEVLAMFYSNTLVRWQRF